MAQIERVTLSFLESLPTTSSVDYELSSNLPGLSIQVRSTTSSFSDYPDWSMEELFFTRENVVTDGTCS